MFWTLKNPVDSLMAIEDTVDAVVHCAALIPAKFENANDAKDYYVVNGLAIYDLLTWCVSKSIHSFIYMSSGSRMIENAPDKDIIESYRYNPEDEYLSSKCVGELIVRQFMHESKIKANIFRIFAPYGYTGNPKAVIPRFINLATQRDNIELWGAGTRSQTFTFVEDIGKACELAIKKGSSDTFNIAGSESISMKLLAENVTSIWGGNLNQIVHLDKIDPEEGRIVTVSIDKAHKCLDYNPSTIESNLKLIKADTDKPFRFCQYTEIS